MLTFPTSSKLTPSLVKVLEYNVARENKNVSVHGYIEEGTITTPFDMRVKNEIDRFNLVLETTKLISDDFDKFAAVNYCVKELIKHNEHIKMFGNDLPEVENWKWTNN